MLEKIGASKRVNKTLRATKPRTLKTAPKARRMHAASDLIHKLINRI